MVCKPNEIGGLEIVNFQKQNASLMIKFFDKFYNQAEITWVQLIWHALYDSKVSHDENLCGSFWWRDVLKLVDNVRGVASVQLENGNTFLFWFDNWAINDCKQPMKFIYPRLFSLSLTTTCRRPKCSSKKI
jgi:hypothetical protein